MTEGRGWRRALVTLAAAAVPWLVGGPAAAQTPGVTMEWLSWSHFRFTSPTGKVLLTNPFVTNPDSPIKLEDVTKADIILVADGHGDEVGSAPEIAIKTGAKIVAVRELATGLLKLKGVAEGQLPPAGIGDVLDMASIRVRLVNSVHGSGVHSHTPQAPYGGPAAGFMITFENGLTVYFAGSTALTMDMQLWGSLYRPDVAILPLAGRRDPRDLAHMARLLRTENPNLKTVIPHHHRLKPPPGAPTPADLEREIKALGLPVTVLNPELGKIYPLSR